MFKLAAASTGARPDWRLGRFARAAEPLCSSQWIERRCGRSRRFAPKSSESCLLTIEFIATSESAPDIRMRPDRRGRKCAPCSQLCIHPPNDKPTRKQDTETSTAATTFDV